MKVTTYPTDAWWLSKIKVYGQETGMKYTIVAEEQGITAIMVKQAIDNLTLRNLIRMTGTGGRAGYKYELTTLGHRYLNEHQDEVNAPFGALTIIKQEQEKEPPKRHSVPTNPVYTGPPETKHQPDYAATIVPPEHDEPELVVKPDRPDPIAIARFAANNGYQPDDDTQHLPTVTPHSDTPPPEPAKHQPHHSLCARDALKEILYKRFADQVTAQELIEYMEGQPA